MATVIDSLVMELGLDNKKFKQGIRESEKEQDDFKKQATVHSRKTEDEDKKSETEKKRRHNEEVRQHKETLENYKKMREDLLKFFLIFTAGKELKDFVNETVRGALEIGQLHEATGVATETIAGLGVVFGNVGGKASEANDMIMKLTKSVGEIGHSDDALINGTQQAGGIVGMNLPVAELAQSHDPLALAKFRADALKKFNELKKAKDLRVSSWDELGFTRLMQMGGHETDISREGGEELEKKWKEGGKLSGMNDKKAAIAAKAIADWNKLLVKLEAIGSDVLFPLLEKITKLLNNKGVMADLTAALGMVADALEALTDGLLKVVHGLTLLYKLKEGTTALGRAYRGVRGESTEQDKKDEKEATAEAVAVRAQVWQDLKEMFSPKTLSNVQQEYMNSWPKEVLQYRFGLGDFSGKPNANGGRTLHIHGLKIDATAVDLATLSNFYDMLERNTPADQAAADVWNSGGQNN